MGHGCTRMHADKPSVNRRRRKSDYISPPLYCHGPPASQTVEDEPGPLAEGRIGVDPGTLAKNSGSAVGPGELRLKPRSFTSEVESNELGRSAGGKTRNRAVEIVESVRA